MPRSPQELLDHLHRWPLSKGLSHALLWAEEVGDAEFTRWIRLEALGYSSTNPAMTEQTVVPEYRTVSGQWFDDYGRGLVLSDPKLAFINETRLRLGVAELEGYVGVNGILALPIPEHAGLIREHLKVDVSTFRFDARAVPPLLGSIRAQLTDRLSRQQSKTVGQRPKATVSAHQDEEILELRPNFVGIGINLRALWRRWRNASGEN